MAEGNYILYYSDYCEYCLSLLKEIHNSNLDEIFTNFNVDQNRNRLPEFVQEVPCVYITEYKHLLSGEEVFGLINHMKKELNINNSQQQMQPSQQQMQPSQQQMQPYQQQMQPYQQQMQPSQQQQIHPSERNIQNNQQQVIHPSQQQELNNPQSSDSDELEAYSICEMGGCSDNYSYLDDSPDAKIIQHNYELINDGKIQNSSINQNSDIRPQSSNSDMNGKKKFQDDELQKLIAARRNDMPNPVERM
jgi:hypothetical protein